MRLICAALVLGLLVTPLPAQPVTGDVVCTGFRAAISGGPGYMARPGQWTPIQVRLTVQGSQPFQGQLRCEAPDLDGDLVSFLEAPVTVTPDAGARRFWCYAAWAQDPFASARPPTLDVLDEDGRLVSKLALPQFELIGADSLLLVDVSENRLVRLNQLQTPGWNGIDPGYGARPYYRNVAIATLAPGELPDRWIGLDSADVILWDAPRPAAVSIAQMQALKQWVRSGGQLILGLGQSWPLLEKSELAEILPVQSPTLRPAGAEGGTARQTLETQRLDEFFAELVAAPFQRERAAGERTFRAPISVANVVARPGALVQFRSRIEGGAELDLITAQWFGSGRVVAVAALLRDLLDVPVTDAFFAQLIDVNPVSDKFREKEVRGLLMLNTRYLYSALIRPISSVRTASLLVLAAFAFVIGYILVATLASWWWLRSHALTSLSWTVFAVFAVVASTLSLGTVSVLHGVARGVRTFSLIDLADGSPAAQVRAYFGYTSPVRERITLSLAGEGGFLRPLTPGPKGSGSFATPYRYAAQPRKGVLEETPLRATLKQFEGYWPGEAGGSVRTQLVAQRADGQLTPDSWVQNDLGVEVLGGVLLYVDPRLPGTGRRAAGQTANYLGRTGVSPAFNVIALPVPGIPPGGRVDGLGQELYRWVLAEQARWRGRRDAKLEDRPDLPTLWDQQQLWAGAYAREFGPHLRRWDDTSAHAFLASTRSFYLHCRQNFEDVNNIPVTADGLMGGDVSHWLAQGWVRPSESAEATLGGQGVLLLAAAAAGPAELRGDGRRLGPLAGQSIYRVRVPLRYVGLPPAEPPGEGP